ncbi:hypothetical protein [Nocardioides jiangxiensis]|uniref:Uncharacterized protein n=1 Tax=Nocardioides jiangxiensis TaxID=3064524 RepID=A0ABT9B5M2_9ACTN|nr:hypothetical protein [Nocardioides sp. WY-20]MDO7868606.1 hypothetical protein [Nocardioides sp. WY-20]
MLKFLLIVVLLALAIYGCVMLVDRQLNGTRAGRPLLPRRPQQPRRPLGPDDDPEFLRQLNRRKPPKREGPPDAP